MSPPTEIPRPDGVAPVPDLVPVRMLNEFAYCPRLMYLEWVQGEWAESADTLDGTFQHRRVDHPGGHLPAPEKTGEAAGGDGAPPPLAASPVRADVIHSRSVPLSAPELGLTAVIDLVEANAECRMMNDESGEGEGEGGGVRATPVDYKRGRVPDVPGRAWEPERVQLCAQGLILRANGYRCDAGVLYFVESRTRVPVAFDDALVARTLELLGQMRAVAASREMPPPLVDSPKCPRCSLVGICLPDETRLLGEVGGGGQLVQVGVPARADPGPDGADASLAAGLARRDPGTRDAGAAGADGAECNAADAGDEDAPPARVRRLIPRSDDGRPLYVTEARSWVGKSGDVVQVRAPADDPRTGGGAARVAAAKPGRGRPAASGRGDGANGSGGTPGGGDNRVVLAEVRLTELSHVCLFGTPQISTQLVHELLDRQLPLMYFSSNGYFRGMTTALASKNIELRIQQYRRAADPAFCLALAKAMTAGKVENQRTLLRRNHEDAPAVVLEDLRLAILSVGKVTCLESLLGVEGNAAKAYFGCFQGMLRPRNDCSAGFPACTNETTADEAAGDGEVVSSTGLRPEQARKPALQLNFDFAGRNKRPPTDPVNALLSLGYAILAKDLTAACWGVGLDPFLGFYHQPRFGRPSLALDLMEEFRPLVVDSTVLTAINTGVIAPSDFIRRGPAVALKPDGRRRFLAAYERRMEALITHPVFGYRLSYRRVLEVQARLLAKVLLGDVPRYASFTTR